MASSSFDVGLLISRRVGASAKCGDEKESLSLMKGDCNANSKQCFVFSIMFLK